MSGLQEQREELGRACREVVDKILGALRDDPRQLVAVVVAVWLACLVLLVGTYACGPAR